MVAVGGRRRGDPPVLDAGIEAVDQGGSSANGASFLFERYSLPMNYRLCIRKEHIGLPHVAYVLWLYLLLSFTRIDSLLPALAFSLDE